MNELNSLLNWFADHAGVRLLALCPNLQEGFEDVIIMDSQSFYGIHQTIEPDQLEMLNQNKVESLHTLATQDFPKEYIPRFLRVATDMYYRSKTEGFEFYNGKLARIIGATVKSGRNAYQPILNLNIGYTSYFTAIATNIYMRGYKFRYLQHSIERSLPREADWVCELNWRKSLRKSSLANALAIHLFLYNEHEIIYVKRGKVGQAPGLWSSPINGVMEFDTDRPDMVSGRPDIKVTAVREALYELNLKINPKDIKWIGLVASKGRCEPCIIGVCKTHLSRSQIARIALESREQREIHEKAKSAFRKKKIRSIYRNWNVKTKNISFVIGSLTIPYHFSSPAKLGKILRNKILEKSEKEMFQRETNWTSVGATALLLCLAHLTNPDEFISALSAIK